MQQGHTQRHEGLRRTCRADTRSVSQAERSVEWVMEHEFSTGIKSLWDPHRVGALQRSILDQRQLKRGNHVPSRGPAGHKTGSVSPRSQGCSSQGRTVSWLTLQPQSCANTKPPAPAKLWGSHIKVCLSYHVDLFWKNSGNYWEIYYCEIYIENSVTV